MHTMHFFLEKNSTVTSKKLIDNYHLFRNCLGLHEKENV